MPSTITAVDVRALRLHSKFEEFAQSIQDQYKVTDAGGNYDGTLSTPESRIHAAAVAAKKEFPNIVNDKVIEYYNKAAVSDYYANLWRQEVTPGIGRSLKQAQRDTAGFLHLWFQTYVGDKPVPHTEIKDVNGNVVTSGKGYLIVPAAYPKRGLTYEWYSLNRYDYVMLSNTSSDNRVNGTPIEIVFDLENNGELHQGQSVLLSMKQSSYADYTYLNWSNTSSWVHLAKRASDTARFKLKANPNRPNEYFIYTDGYPLNYQHNGDAKSWAVLGKRTDQPDAWMIVPAP